MLNQFGLRIVGGRDGASVGSHRCFNVEPPPPIAAPQVVRPAFTFIGFPLSSWAYALRIWAAMVVALYAAFWLQLSSAATAATTVGILALRTRGHAYQKGAYRILSTTIGVVASIVIAGLLDQTRDLFMLGFAGWLGICVYVGARLDGNRAYGGVLAGYTVAIVAVIQIDSPQNVFSAGINRGAAIVVGIAALGLISDVFAAPNVFSGLSEKLVAAHKRVRDFVLGVLRGEAADPVRAANLMREITALHPDFTALIPESSNGPARCEAARRAAVALIAEVGAASALASLPAGTLTSLRQALADAVADGLGERIRALQPRLRHSQANDADPHDPIFARHAVALLTEHRRAQDAIEDLQAGRDPPRRVGTPIYRSRRAAMRRGAQAFLAVLISAFLLSLSGWPQTSVAVALVGVTIAFSAIAPNPRAFAIAAVIAMPIAALMAGVTEFLILNGVDQFPLLAIGMAPSVLVAGLLYTAPNPKLAPIGFFMLIFIPVILSPENPQAYNPETYLFTSLLAITAVILLFVIVSTVLPTTAAHQRHWYLTSAQAELSDLLAGRRSRYGDDEAMFRDADRIGQLVGLAPAVADERRDDVRQAIDIFGRAVTARRLRKALAELSAGTTERLAVDGYSALAGFDAVHLRWAAAALAGKTALLDHDGQTLARGVITELISAAFLVESSSFGFTAHRSTAP